MKVPGRKLLPCKISPTQKNSHPGTWFESIIIYKAKKCLWFLLECISNKPEAVLDTMFDCSTSLLAGEIFVEVFVGGTGT